MRINTLLLFFLLAMFIAALLQVHLFEIAFAKLGISPAISLLLLIATLFGSGINIPIYSVHTRAEGHWVSTIDRKMIWEIYQPARAGKTIIAVNLGGCLIPLGLSLYFISLQVINPLLILLGVLAIGTLSHKTSQLIPGMGVGMPILIAPLTAAVFAIIVAPTHAAHLAYISGVLGVLLGADILKLKAITQLGAPIAAIGGAGTFDGIFMTGIIAALLA